MRSLSIGTDGDPLDMYSNDANLNLNTSITEALSYSGIGASSSLLADLPKKQDSI